MTSLSHLPFLSRTLVQLLYSLLGCSKIKRRETKPILGLAETNLSRQRLAAVISRRRDLRSNSSTGHRHTGAPEAVLGGGGWRVTSHESRAVRAKPPTKLRPRVLISIHLLFLLGFLREGALQHTTRIRPLGLVSSVFGVGFSLT